MNPNIKFSLTAIEAKDLMAGDSNGLSDPYFKIPHKQRGVIDLPKKTNRTKTIMKTLNPKWNHTFECEFNPQACNKLAIEVYDYDFIGKDDLLGTAEVNLQWMINGGQDTFEEWIPLKITVKDKKTKLSQVMQKGSVHIKLQVKHRPNQPPGMQPNQYQVPQMGQQPQYMGQQPHMQQPPYMGQQPQYMGQPPHMQQPPYMGQQPQYMGQPPHSQQPPYMQQPPSMQQSQYIQQPPMGQPPNTYPSMGPQSNMQPPIGQQPLQQNTQNQPPLTTNDPNKPQLDINAQNQPPLTTNDPNKPQLDINAQNVPPLTTNDPNKPQLEPNTQNQPPLTTNDPNKPQLEPNAQNQPPLQPNTQNQQPLENQQGQQPLENPQGQQPLLNAPGQPPIPNQPGQPPIQNQPGQPPIPNQPGQPPIPNQPGQPPIQNQPGQPPIQNQPGQPPIPNQPGQPPIQNQPGQPPIPNQPGQPPIPNQPGQPPIPNQPGQPPIPNQPGQPPIPNQPGQPPYPNQPGQPPYGQQPYQTQYSQSPYGQPPSQAPYGQPPYNQPQYYSQVPYGQPPTAQQLHRSATYGQQPPNAPLPGQKPTLMRPPTFQQPSLMPPPAQRSMMPPAYGPHLPQPYPAQYSQPPLANPGMPRPVTAPVGKVPMFGAQMSAVPMMGAMPPGVNIATSHMRGAPLQPGTWIPVREPDVMVGLGWDFTGRETFDLDASVTGFDSMFNLVDTIYFNHKKGLSGSVIHFGDNTTGEGEGDDEVIQIILHRVPMNVRYLAVTINSFKKNSLIRARSAFIRLYTRTYHIGKYLLTRTKDCIGLLLGVFERSQDPYMWYFRVMADPIKGNKVTLSIDDIKELLGAYSISKMAQRRIVHPLPGEPLIEFNKWIKLPNRFLYVGLGWNIQQGMNYDLDASIITFDKMNNLMEIIYHKNMQSYNSSILHYGDNRTGAGEGDDEVLSVDFAALNPNVFTMAVVVNSFKGNTMVHILDAFIRIYDAQRPIGVHVLNKCPDCIGLCLGIFRKDMNGVWSFCAIKEIVRGIVVTESVNDVMMLLGKYPLKA